MNAYVVGLNVRGKTGREYGLPLEIEEAKDKEDAITQAKKEAEEEGFEVACVDYCDLLD